MLCRNPLVFSDIAEYLCSVSLVKVCQWVTLTQVQSCREGGVSELGHMVFTLIATRNRAESRRAHAWTGAPGTSERCSFDRR